MSTRKGTAETVERIAAERIIATLRGFSPSEVTDIARVLVDQRIRIIEVTLDSPDAIASIDRLSDELGAKALVGAGTVLDGAEADAAIEAGARFCVSPVTLPEVIERCVSRDVLAVPGALSPSEIFNAWRAGAAMVKVFPGRVGGPGYIRDLRGPLPEIPLVVTGGVDAGNAGEFLLAGAAAVGIGSSLVSPATFVSGEVAQLAESARSLRQGIQMS